MAKKKNFIEKMFDGVDGQLSTKKLFGGFIIIVVLGCTAVSIFKNGLTHEAVEILNTSMIVGATLLGLTSITSIWKNTIFNVKDKCDDEPRDDNNRERKD